MRIDHIAHVCRAPHKTHDFYAGILGLELTQAYAGRELTLVYALPDGGSLVFSARAGDARGHSKEPEWEREHVGLTVATRSQFNAWLQRLRDTSVPHRLVDDERIYFSDPDGLVLEIEVASTTAADAAALDVLARWQAR